MPGSAPSPRNPVIFALPALAPHAPLCYAPLPSLRMRPKPDLTNPTSLRPFGRAVLAGREALATTVVTPRGEQQGGASQLEPIGVCLTVTLLRITKGQERETGEKG